MSSNALRVCLVLATGAVVIAAYSWRVRPWFLRWGATSGVLRPNWPADDCSPAPETEAIRSVTVHAAAAEVWRWVVQVGQDRGGFYSYSRLENLAGCEMENADRILPDCQSRAVGDTVWLTAPHNYGGNARVTVAYLEPERAMVLMAPDDAEAVSRGEESSHGYWAFELHPVDEAACRLVMRSSNGRRPTCGELAVQRLFWEPAHFVMERKMMLTIKKLAEANLSEGTK